MMKKIVALSEALIRFTHYAAALLLAVAALLVFYQVATRALLGDAAVWSEVMARATIIWSVFLVAGGAFRHAAMIPIDFLRSLLPPPQRKWLIRLSTGAILVFLGVLVWYGYAMTERVISQRVAMLNISVAWLYAALPVGALLAVPGVLLAHRDAEVRASDEDFL